MSDTRATLIEAGTELIRRRGFVATTVNQICGRAGVTKGAFFHHFESKQALAGACLAAWNTNTEALFDAALADAPDDPVARALACLDAFIALFCDPEQIRSCLAGTTVQEVYETHPALREAAHDCFVHAERRVRALLDAACTACGRTLDTASLASLWIAAVQGALLMHKASGDEAVIPSVLRHVRGYIAAQLGETC